MYIQPTVSTFLVDPCGCETPRKTRTYAAKFSALRKMFKQGRCGSSNLHLPKILQRGDRLDGVVESCVGCSAGP